MSAFDTAVLNNVRNNQLVYVYMSCELILFIPLFPEESVKSFGSCREQWEVARWLRFVMRGSLC
jgi:hypothetical protein